MRFSPRGKYRLCLDYRPFNQVTKLPVYPLPRAHQALNTLQGKKYFTTFYLLKAYWQILIHKDIRKYLAFATPDRLYEWLRMRFEITGASAVPNQIMDSLLAGKKRFSALASLDDIVIYSKTLEEHLSSFKLLFSFPEAGTSKSNVAKSTLCKSETTYLCFIVSAQGVKPDPKEIESAPNILYQGTVKLWALAVITEVLYVIMQDVRILYKRLCCKKPLLCEAKNRIKLLMTLSRQ